jgi:hypothetical protein
MAGTPGKTARPKASGTTGSGARAAGMKNAYPLILLVLLALALAFGYLFTSSAFQPAQGVPDSGAPAGAGICQDGQARPCVVGNCSGQSTCVGGAWGGCKWERVCTPKTSVPCINGSCAYAIRTCNECGTGYGPCAGINANSAQ